MNITATRILQKALSAKGFNSGAIDGRMTAQTRAAVAEALARLTPVTATDWQIWPVDRQAVLCLQALCLDADLHPGPLDGWWGPQTEYACGQLASLQDSGHLPEAWRDRFPVPANPNLWPLEREPELDAFYGKPGENLVMLDLPYPLRLSWDTSTTVLHTQCNPRVRDSLHKVLARVQAHYGLADIRKLRLDLYGGGFNKRAKRGGTGMSTHAWGIAFDFDPDHNKLEWKGERAGLARPEYEAWWRFWEEEGWVSLGRTKNYDWMHVQAARI